MESIISTFHLDWKIIVAQAINFAIVAAVLYFFALKPLNKLMDKRAAKIAQGLADAKSNADLLKANQIEYQKIINQAKAEAYMIFQENKKEIENKRAIMLQETKDEITSLLADSKKRLVDEKNKMLAETKKEIAFLAVKTAEKLLGTKLDESFNIQAIKELQNIHGQNIR